MKRMIAMILALVMLLTLSACGKDPQPNTEQPKDTTSNNTPDNPTETEGNNTSIFDGNVTEDVVRNYKVASEDQFVYTEQEGGVRVSGYTGSDKIVVIPEKLGGKSVVAVDPLLFGNESPVRGVYIPNTVTSLIGTFTNSTAIEVVICEGVEELGDNVFNSCTKLHTVVLGDKLTSLGNSTFFSCSALKELYIPASLTTIDESYATTVFFWCDSLTIRGESGSFIEGFCSAQGLNFKAK